MSVCSQCLRTLRHRGLRDLGAQPIASTRSLSTSIRRARQASQQAPSPTPPPIPTTTPTATTNIAAEQHAGKMLHQNDANSNLSVSEMQRQIQSGMRPTPLPMRLAQSLRGVAPETTETYITYGVARTMLNSCAAQAAYTIPEEQRAGLYTGQGPPVNARQEHLGIPDTENKLSKGVDSWWFKDLGLEPTFSVWSQVTFLHMYMLTVRLRALPSKKSYLEYQKYLLEHMSAEAEDRMSLMHGMGSSRTVRTKYLKDMFIQWRGVVYAYDEGLVKGDAVLASAVWRNLWKADENVDWEQVAAVVAYMRKCLTKLSNMSMDDITTSLQRDSSFWESAHDSVRKLVEQSTARTG